MRRCVEPSKLAGAIVLSGAPAVVETVMANSSTGPYRVVLRFVCETNRVRDENNALLKRSVAISRTTALVTLCDNKIDVNQIAALCAAKTRA